VAYNRAVHWVDQCNDRVPREAATSEKKKQLRSNTAHLGQHRRRPKRGAHFRVFEKADRQVKLFALVIVAAFIVVITLQALLT
jgi:hypothetical protein